MKSILTNRLPLMRSVKQLLYKMKPYRAKFRKYYLTGDWSKVEKSGSEPVESVSGPGSTLKATRIIIEQLPQLFDKFNIRTVVDIPCGDFNWMKEVDLEGIDYQGFDIVQELIDSNISKYQTDNINFGCLDLMNDVVPKADLIVCRDLLIHYPTKFIIKAIRKMKKSGSMYLLSTSYITLEVNKELDTIGLSRPINLEKPPFNFPKPLFVIDEEIDEEREGRKERKTSGLWRFGDINI